VVPPLLQTAVGHNYTKIIPDPDYQRTTYTIIGNTAHTSKSWTTMYADDNRLLQQGQLFIVQFQIFMKVYH
jgi:hypothetical protein